MDPKKTKQTKFFVVQKVDGSMKNVSAILIHKTISGMVGNVASIKKCNSGTLLIETSTSSQSELLMKLNKIGEHNIQVSPHKSLNYSRGVISEPDLQFDSESEILENLKDQDVCEVKRITIRRDGQIIPTRHIKLTFNTPTLPKYVKIAYLQCSVRPFIPNPLRCFKCQRFGHSVQACRGNETCARCSVVGHDSKTCNSPPICINCKQSHPSYYRSCPKWQEEKEIQTIKITKNITYIEARKLVTDRTPKPGVSYSSTVSKKSSTIETQTDHNITKFPSVSEQIPQTQVNIPKGKTFDASLSKSDPTPSTSKSSNLKQIRRSLTKSLPTESKIQKRNSSKIKEKHLSKTISTKHPLSKSDFMKLKKSKTDELKLFISDEDEMLTSEDDQSIKS